MSDKNCNNCRNDGFCHYDSSHEVSTKDCAESKYKNWKPNYKTLESQLQAANEQIGRIRERLETIREFTPSSALDEHLPDGDKVKCYEMGYEDALGDICVLVTEILSQPQPAPADNIGSHPLRYFLIIGSYIKYPMGCCTSEVIENVHSEEPDARFYEIPKEEFNVFRESNYDKNTDWYCISKTYEELTAPADNDILEIHLYECGHIVKKPCNDLVCPICEQIGREREEKEIYKGQFIKLIEQLENELNKDGWCRLVITHEGLQEFKSFLLQQQQPTPADTRKEDNNG